MTVLLEYLSLPKDLLLLLLLFCFTVSNTEGLTATCATAFVTYQTGTEVIRTVLDLAYNKV